MSIEAVKTRDTNLTLSLEYQDLTTCPLCGSPKFVTLPPQTRLILPSPVPPQEAGFNAIVRFTPALCRHCGLSYNRHGLTPAALGLVLDHYHFLKPSEGLAVANYAKYVQRLGCTYDLLFSAVRHTVKPSLRAVLGAQRISACF